MSHVKWRAPDDEAPVIGLKKSGGGGDDGGGGDQVRESPTRARSQVELRKLNLVKVSGDGSGFGGDGLAFSSSPTHGRFVSAACSFSFGQSSENAGDGSGGTAAAAVISRGGRRGRRHRPPRRLARVRRRRGGHGGGGRRDWRVRHGPNVARPHRRHPGVAGEPALEKLGI